MGMTRATGGPVRCPWCARPVSDGPGSPEACPSCGVPLSPTIIGSRPADAPVSEASGRARKSQRLRALATVLALTAVMLVISAIGVAAAVLRANGSDRRARADLQLALRAAESVKMDTGTFTQATAAAIRGRVPQVSIRDAQVASTDDRQISMMVSSDGSGWYGAVKSRSGRCYAAGTVNANPVELTTILPGNCTGDAARASLMKLPTPPEVMTTGSVPPTAATDAASSSG